MTARRLKNVPDAELDDYIDYHWDAIEAEAGRDGIDPEEFLFDDLVRRNCLDRFGPEVLDDITAGLMGDEEVVGEACWMGGILDGIEKACRDA